MATGDTGDAVAPMKGMGEHMKRKWYILSFGIAFLHEYILLTSIKWLYSSIENYTP